MEISGKTRLLGVIGHPISHSLSPRMHNAAFAADHTDYAYVAMDVDPERLPHAVRGLSALGFVGFNVTMPHKERIIPLLDGLDEASRISGAVNTVKIDEDGLHGINTDGSGFVEACAEADVSFSGRRVLIIGAGGAAAAVSVAILAEGVGELVISNRTSSRAEDLQAKLSQVSGGAGVRVRPPEQIAEEAGKADVIINTTYLGMKEKDPLPVPPGCLGSDKAVCDAVYLRNKDTDLIREARNRGARVVPGGRMLLYQGVQAQRVWIGREPNVEAMSNALVG